MSNAMKHCKDCNTTVMCHLERRCQREAHGLSAVAGSEYAIIGWISHGMDVYKTDQYKAMSGKPDVRKPPKIYKTEAIAKRYGEPTPVYIKIQNK